MDCSNRSDLPTRRCHGEVPTVVLWSMIATSLMRFVKSNVRFNNR